MPWVMPLMRILLRTFSGERGLATAHYSSNTILDLNFMNMVIRRATLGRCAKAIFRTKGHSQNEIPVQLGQLSGANTYSASFVALK